MTGFSIENTTSIDKIHQQRSKLSRASFKVLQRFSPISEEVTPVARCALCLQSIVKYDYLNIN